MYLKRSEIILKYSIFFQLKATFCLPIIGVKKNPQSPMYTSLGVITKGTVIEVLLNSQLNFVIIWGVGFSFFLPTFFRF